MADTAALEQPKGAPSARNDRMASAKSSIKYLLDPQKGPQPQQLRTRAFLRSVRYLTIFIFWRLVRYAKYAAVGALTAAVAGTAIGSVFSGAAFIIAPTGILGGAGVGIMWAVARLGWKRAHRSIQRRGENADPRQDERADAEESGRPVAPLPRSDPW